jgi:hypothetical protein
VPQSPNKILAALPARDYQRLRPVLRTVHLPAESVLPHCGYTRVYFPGTGLCSVITRMADDSMIEVACVGNEGAVGVPTLSGEFQTGQNAHVQVGDGSVQYLPIVLFEHELARSPVLRELLDSYCHSFLETSIQSVACNRLHSTEQRCCRWLLSVHDRIGRVRFELKVRFLARAMGVKNSEIATLLDALEDHGVIRHDDESITIVDTVGLRALACRCYDAMKRAYTLAVPVIAHRKPRAVGESAGARILPMRPAAGACTLCGSSVRLPHRNGHECILALDEEIRGLVRRTHTLGKFRAQLVSQRAQLFRDILKRTAGGIVKRTLP